MHVPPRKRPVRACLTTTNLWAFFLEGLRVWKTLTCHNPSGWCWRAVVCGAWSGRAAGHINLGPLALGGHRADGREAVGSCARCGEQAPCAPAGAARMRLSRLMYMWRRGLNKDFGPSPYREPLRGLLLQEIAPESVTGVLFLIATCDPLGSSLSQDVSQESLSGVHARPRMFSFHPSKLRYGHSPNAILCGNVPGLCNDAQIPRMLLKPLMNSKGQWKRASFEQLYHRAFCGEFCVVLLAREIHSGARRGQVYTSCVHGVLERMERMLSTGQQDRVLAVH